MTSILPTSNVSRVQRQGCTAVKSFTRHWTCLFPQHGPGLKHTRRILLHPWQTEVVDILDLCAAALDRLGIDHRRSRPDTISVARRAAVETLDEHVGPKS